MSIRKGGPHKTERKNVKIDEDAHAALLKYAQSKGIGMRLILSEFIFKGVKFDISEEDWIEKLKAQMRITTGYSSMGDCDGLAFGENKDGDGVYTCVWYREGRPPQIRVLGKSEDLQKARCAACGRTEEIHLGFKERDTRIRELEEKIQMKARQTNKVPICNGGAILTQEGTAFRSCRKRPGQVVNIETFCRKLTASGTLPCALYAEVELAEGPL